MLVRNMQVEDLKQVASLEHKLFTSPWNYDDFLNDINDNPFAHDFVFVQDDRVIGYVCLMIMYEQSQITTIGVDSCFQGQGYGKLLMNYAIDYACQHGCESMTLEVRVSNEVAIALYESVGFSKEAIRKNYYQDNYEDAYLMLKELEGTK